MILFGFGVIYPTRYIIAVFDNAAQDEHAVAAVKQAGYYARHARPQLADLLRGQYTRHEAPFVRKGILGSCSL